MKTRHAILLSTLLAAPALFAQGPPAPPPEPRGSRVTREIEKKIILRKEMGKWWRDSDTAKKLQLSESQIGQLDQIFFDHRIKLIDFGADMEKQDMKLQSLLDADAPDEGQIGSQVDSVLAARGKLEREYTFMNLDLRKVLSLDQWRQLKSIRTERGQGENIIYFHKRLDGPGAGPMHAPFAPDMEIDVQPPAEPNL